LDYNILKSLQNFERKIERIDYIGDEEAKQYVTWYEERKNNYEEFAKSFLKGADLRIWLVYF